MIWFPMFAQCSAQNCYFDLRDADIRYRRKEVSGMVSGILGIDETEFWAEIRIGHEWDIQILPVWNDNGQVDNIPDTINQDVLKQALADEIKRVLPDFYPGRCFPAPHYSEPSCLLALDLGEQQAA